MSKNQNPQFAMIPFKLKKLRLCAYDVALFYVLRSFGDKDGMDIFPSMETLMEESSMSRERIWKSLKSLRDHRVIEWESGWKGHPNRYRINQVGLWKDINSSPHERNKQFATRTNPVRPSGGNSSPHELHLDPGSRSKNYYATASEESEKEGDGYIHPDLIKQFVGRMTDKITGDKK